VPNLYFATVASGAVRSGFVSQFSASYGLVPLRVTCIFEYK
jgi:hypothetical protein